VATVHTRWPAELSRACRVRPSRAATAPPARGLVVPWDLVVASGTALRDHRHDLYDLLVDRADGSLRIGDRVLGRAEGREQVRRLHHAAVGRLRCVGSVPAERRVGWVSWLLFADGWRALTPYVADDPAGGPMVRLDPRTPHDLAPEVARRTMGGHR
jgi:hypothetical protein